MDQILPVILKDTYSLTQLKARLNILKAFLLQNFFGSSKPTLSQNDESYLKSLPTVFFQQFNKDNVYNLFSELDHQTSQLPALTIYLSFEADERTLAQIGSQVRKAFNPSMLLDVKYDPNLIAGAALAWKGIYKDYSLRAKLEEKKGEILEGFKKFLR